MFMFSCVFDRVTCWLHIVVLSFFMFDKVVPPMNMNMLYSCILSWKM